MLFLKRRLHNIVHKMCFTAVVLAVILSGCAEKPSQKISMQDKDYPEPKIPLTTADLCTTCDAPNYIDLNVVTDKVFRITQPGCHVLSGELNGLIQIDAEDQIVHLVLNGVDVDSVYGAALEVVSAGKVIITLQENSENFFLDSGAYPETADSDACIFSKCDLTINGSGDLHVYGYYKDAIHTKDVLKVLGGNLFIQSKRDGLRGNDGIVIRCKSLDVQSEASGLHSTKTGKELKGNIEIYESVCSIIGGEYAIACEADLYISDSSIYAMGIFSDIQAGGKSSIAEGSLQNG